MFKYLYEKSLIRNMLRCTGAEKHINVINQHCKNSGVVLPRLIHERDSRSRSVISQLGRFRPKWIKPVHRIEITESEHCMDLVLRQPSNDRSPLVKAWCANQVRTRVTSFLPNAKTRKPIHYANSYKVWFVIAF